MIAWVLDFVPAWVWYAVAAAALFCTVPWWMPTFIFVWARLPGWAKAAIIGVGAALGAYLAGRNKGRANERDRQRARDARAVQTRVETDHEVASLDDAARRERIGHWMRDRE